tara:strand:+ start:350 stop:1117 length:768 start_codon:yes stop_codon:yes gene_type:complete
MYLFSKIIWVVLNPLNLLLIFLIIGFVFKIINMKIISKAFYTLSLIFFVIVGIFPTGNIILSKLEKSYPALPTLPSHVDGILILGGPSGPGLTREHGQVSFNEAGERLTESVKLIKNYQSSKIIFSGGFGELSHTYVAKKFFSEMGIDISDIIFESNSRNTFENILFSKKIINPKEFENWLLVTSSFHMSRAINVAEKLNWKFIPYPVDFRTSKKLISFKPGLALLDNFNSFNLASHEVVGLISYYLLGRSSKIL